MPAYNDSLTKIFQQSWRNCDLPEPVQSLIVQQANDLLQHGDAPFGLRCQLLSQDTLHRHVMVIYCPDQAFYPDAIHHYLHKQHIQPLAQSSTLFSMSDTNTVRADMRGADKALFLVFHFSATTTENMAQIERDIQHVLLGVHQSVVDFPTMRGELERIAMYLAQDDASNAALLQWMIDDHYLVFGLYDLQHSRKHKGICRSKRLLSWVLPASAEELAAVKTGDAPGMQWLHLSSTFAHLYSAANTRAIRLCWREEDGLHAVVVIGHFSRGARYINASSLPKLEDIWHDMARDVALQQSEFYQREMRILFDRAPKSMLHAIDAAQWLAPFKRIVDMNNPTQAVVARLQPCEGNLDYLLIAVDRYRFGANIWASMQRALARLNIRVFGSETYSVGAVQLVFAAVQAADFPPINHIESAVRQCVIFWKDKAKDALLQANLNTALLHEGLRELNGLAHVYQDQFLPEQFVQDLLSREQLKRDGQTRVRLWLHHDESGQRVEVQVLTPHALPLGAMTDKLNAFALTTMEQSLVPFHHPEQPMYICRFRCDAPAQLHAEGVERLRQGIEDVFNQFADHDPLNALVILCGLQIREVAVLIALRNHMTQMIADVPAHALSEVMIKHPAVTTQLFHMFEARHRQGMPSTAWAQAQAMFNKAMQQVRSLNEDTWLHALADMVDSSLRSNAWVRGQGQALAIKIDPSRLDFAPCPKPYREIFVHGVHVEGIHLRAGKIARGGLRYSDRPTDFRTEVLELMATQVVKNGQIVPTGAKGGFVVRNGEGAGFVLAQYHQFVRALLSVTDNLIQGKVVPPEGVRVAENDRDDAYLVVAADKGTARFSDDANEEAIKAGFWLGDAFASGGSHGYDHKAFGITARGAWVCAAHHFARMGVNLWQDEVRVAGIGDMSGDVFGNGMLLNPNIRLIAAFNHTSVFLDPHPDAAAAFAERKRLFDAVLGWEAYDKSRISQGGGVFERSAKSIVISPEVKQALGIQQDTLSGEALVQAILRAPVDLLYNGGIGTYVKASFESNAEAQDPANNTVRVDAAELRCKVVCEGGNLGFTRAARMEYAKKGGLINTDAIDNAAGVNMSDHEVNLKILLAREPFSRRNRYLKQVAGFVASQCLQDNQEQAIALSLAEQNAEHHLPRLHHLQQQLREEGYLQTRYEDTDLVLRPVFAEWLGHEKNRIHQALDDEGFWRLSVFGEMFLTRYFPKSLRKPFARNIQAHPLAGDIAHTRITSHIINRFGLSSIHYLQNLTNASIASVVQVILIADDLLGVDASHQAFLAQDGQHLQSWYQLQQQVLNFAEGLLLLDSHMQVDHAWLSRVRRGFARFARQQAATPLDLASLATAIPLHEQQGYALSACLRATQQCMAVLPFAPLEASLRSTLWGEKDAHALRCEWLVRLLHLKKQAAQQVLLVSKANQQKLLQAWQSHPLQARLVSLLDDEGLRDEDLRLRYMLAMTHVQSIVECDCRLPSRNA